MIMEQSGHLSTEGVRCYERTTALQQKSLSNALSNITNNPAVPIRNQSSSNVNAEPDGWEKFDHIFSSVQDPSYKQVQEVQKAFNFQNMEGCTFNININ